MPLSFFFLTGLGESQKMETSRKTCHHLNLAPDEPQPHMSAGQQSQAFQQTLTPQPSETERDHRQTDERESWKNWWKERKEWKNETKNEKEDRKAFRVKQDTDGQSQVRDED